MSWYVYERWNAAIADVVFSPDNAGVPVYLDLEDDVLAAVAAAAGVGSGDAEQQLVAAVAATIDRRGSGSIFWAHRRALETWTRSRSDGPPPHVAMLAVLSLAAERMSSSDGRAANDYYGRLAPMLGMENRRDELATAYRRVAEHWWSSLNRWLVRLDGARGLPTAYTLGLENQRYVGLPISQALVRAADREGLVRFFQRAGLAPGSDVPPHSLMPLLDAWIRTTPSPATRSLQRLWSKPTTRERVAEVAAVALAAWDGAARGRADGTGGSDESLRLIATVGGMLRPRLELGALAYLEQPEVARVVTVTTAAGAPELEVRPGHNGALQVAGLEQVDAGSLLDGVLSVRDSLTGRLVTRRPRRVVPFRTNDLLQQLIEADQVQAGEQLVVLVERSVLPGLEALLNEIARPGWAVADRLQGVPDRWAVVRDVEIITRPATAPRLGDLTCLVPLSQSHLSIAKGFVMPGRLRRWHSWDAPEITALDDPDVDLSVHLTRLGVETDEATQPGSGRAAVVRRWSSTDPGFLTVDLKGEGLEDGDYRVELFRDRDTAPASSVVLRLRSADEPDALQWAQAPELVRAPRVHPMSILTARPAGGGATTVRGATVAAPPGEAASADPSEVRVTRAWWEDAHRPTVSTRSPAWSLEPPAPDSCILTGRHYLLVPDARPGRPRVPFVDSTCRGCGLVKRVATTDRAARRRDRGDEVDRPATLDVSKVAPVDADQVHKWTVAMDAVGYLGGGPFSLLERLVLQVEGSALAVDQIVRTLEVLGHVEVERDPRTLAPVSWEVTPSALAETSDGRWSLIGFWPSGLTSELQALVQDVGGDLVVSSPEAGPDCWFVQLPAGVALPSVDELGVAVVPEAAERLAEQLVPLSTVVAALPRRSADLVGDVTVFSPPGAAWVPSASLSAPGAYRVRKWQTVDLVRTPDDVERGTAAVSTVQLSKHVAALGAGRPLLAYDPGTRELTVPLGADLPGLYGRAAVLGSGMPPVAIRNRRRLVYPGVSPRAAQLLLHSLTR